MDSGLVGWGVTQFYVSGEGGGVKKYCTFSIGGIAKYADQILLKFRLPSCLS